MELEAAPWVWRVDDAGGVQAHTGQPARLQAVLMDEAGRVFLHTDLGPGLVHTQDMGRVAERVLAGHWQPQDVAARTLPQHFGYVLSPQQEATKKPA